MIPDRSSRRVKPVPAHDRVRFVAMIPGIRKQLRFAFRHSPPAVRQERIDDGLAQAFVLFAHLSLRKRVRLAHPTALARYAAHRVRSGRPIGSRGNRRDVMSRVTQRRFGFRVISADPGCPAGQPRSSELLGESRQATPAELAAIRVVFATWLSRLSNRHREVALCLAVGEPTGTVARKLHVSCARISQIRGELATRWRQFQGELPQPAQSVSRLSGGRPTGVRLAASTPVDANPAPISVHTLLSAAIRPTPAASPASAWSRTEALCGTSPPTVMPQR
jgi:hypothetical protein